MSSNASSSYAIRSVADTAAEWRRTLVTASCTIRYAARSPRSAAAAAGRRQSSSPAGRPRPSGPATRRAGRGRRWAGAAPRCPGAAQRAQPTQVVEVSQLTSLIAATDARACSKVPVEQPQRHDRRATFTSDAAVPRRTSCKITDRRGAPHDPPPRRRRPPRLGPALLGDRTASPAASSRPSTAAIATTATSGHPLPADGGADEQVHRQADHRRALPCTPPASRDGDHGRDGELGAAGPNRSPVQRVVRGRRGEVPV